MPMLADMRYPTSKNDFLFQSVDLEMPSLIMLQELSMGDHLKQLYFQTSDPAQQKHEYCITSDSC